MTVEDELAELQFITDLSAFNNFKLSIIIISLSLSLFNYCLHCLLAIFSYFLAAFSTSLQVALGNFNLLQGNFCANTN